VKIKYKDKKKQKIRKEEKMKTMIRKIALLLTLALVLGMVPFAQADVIIPQGAKGSITVHKYLMDDVSEANDANDGRRSTATIPSGAIPLPGVEFRVREVVPGTGDVIATIGGVTYVAVTSGYDQMKTTTSSGRARFGNLDVALYLVEELGSDLVTVPAEPFIVSVPTTIEGSTSTANDWLLFNVHCYPKNEDAAIEKFILKDGDLYKSAPYFIDETVTWFITASIPSTLTPGGAYKITDTYSEGLSFTGSLAATAAAHGSLPDVGLVLTTDYTVNANATNRTVEINFTAAGLAKLDGHRILEITLDTLVLDTCPIEEAVPNHAELSFTNSINSHETTRGSDDDDKIDPEMYTGGLRLLKVDAANVNTKLAGARFKLVEKTSSDFAADRAANGYIQRDGSDYVAVTDANGQASFKGLPYGDSGDVFNGSASTEYWLVEVKAPTGYRLLGSPEIVPVYFGSYDVANEITLYNQKGFQFPLTGGTGALLFVVGGVILLGLAGIVAVSKKKDVVPTL